MTNYRFKEVLCPFCKKKYMTQISDDHDIEIIGNSSLKGWITNCTKCNREFFAVDGASEGIDLNKIPEESIRRTYRLR